MSHLEEACSNVQKNVCQKCKKGTIVVIPKQKFVKYLKLGNSLLLDSYCPFSKISK